MWTEQYKSIFALMVVVGIMYFFHELNRPQPNTLKGISALTETYPMQETFKLTALTAQQKAWAEKAVKKYAEAQGKKWERWNKAMFEATK